MYYLNSFSKRQGFNYAAMPPMRTWRTNHPPKVWWRLSNGVWRAITFIIFDYAHTQSTRFKNW